MGAASLGGIARVQEGLERRPPCDEPGAAELTRQRRSLGGFRAHQRVDPRVQGAHDVLLVGDVAGGVPACTGECRDAFVGSSLRLDMALTEQKPPMPLGKTAASLAPASMRSASPLRMWSTLFRMQKFPDAQALLME